MEKPDAKQWQSLVKTFLQKAEKPLVVILGPTTSGKTAFSIELCSYLGNAEVINADSRQLYRYLDIGTAKITEEEMCGVPHHLINVLDPNEEATAGWYQSKAREVIDDVLSRGKIPVLVGGSMLYISSVIDGLTLVPASDDRVRERLMEEYDSDSGARLHARLQEIDPEAAERIHQNNKPRLIRAMEIFELTSLPKSKATPQSELGKQSTDRYDLLILGITKPRSELHERINARVKMMFDAGWIEEVQGLLDRGYTSEDPGMKSHGYRDIVEHLKKNVDDLEDLQESIAAKTRQYAKRQITWWRRDSRIRWFQDGNVARQP